MRLKELRQKRGELTTQMRAISDKAHTEKRSLTTEENTEWDRLDKAQDELRKEIEREERLLEVERETAAKAGRPAEDRGGHAAARTPEEARAAYAEAFRSWCRDGYSGMADEQRNALKSLGRSEQLTAAEMKELRAQGVATGAAGGFTVPQAFSGEYDRALKSFSGMLQACRIVPTDSGATLPWPSVNDTAQLGEQLGENTGAAQQDVTFGNVNFSSYKYSSKIMLVSIELLQDTAFDIESLLGSLAGERIGRILNQRLTTGTGSSQPNGAVTAATLGFTLPTGNTTSETYAGLINLEHSVDPAYRQAGGCAYMMHDTTLKAVKLILDSQNRPLWQAGIKEGTQDSINGYSYYINQDMAVPAANAKTILFGNFKKYIARQVRDTFLFRFGEKYMDAGQIGFVAFARWDGNLVDAGTHPLTYLAQSAT